MRLRRFPLVRVAFGSLAAMTAAAVLLGHDAAARRRCARGSDDVRTSAPPFYRGPSGYNYFSGELAHCLVDTRSGAVLPCTVPEIDRIDVLGCSRWRDRDGQLQLMVRCRNLAGKGEKELGQESELAPCAYPSGRILQRIPHDALPLGPVCWDPDTSDRILFASSDGMIYLHTPKAPAPSPLRWDTSMLGPGKAFFHKLCWPTHPALQRCLVVTASFGRGRVMDVVSRQLWWLKLSSDARAVVGAGPVIGVAGDAPPDAQGQVVYLPAVGTALDGAPLLAYLGWGREPRRRSTSG